MARPPGWPMRRTWLSARSRAFVEGPGTVGLPRCRITRIPGPSSWRSRPTRRSICSDTSGGWSEGDLALKTPPPDGLTSRPLPASACPQLIGKEPDPQAAVQAAEECQEILDRFSDTILRAIALWKMEGFTTEEIASKLDCTTRTVERKLQLIRRLWGCGAHSR